MPGSPAQKHIPDTSPSLSTIYEGLNHHAGIICMLNLLLSSNNLSDDDITQLEQLIKEDQTPAAITFIQRIHHERIQLKKADQMGLSALTEAPIYPVELAEHSSPLSAATFITQFVEENLEKKLPHNTDFAAELAPTVYPPLSTIDLAQRMVRSASHSALDRTNPLQKASRQSISLAGGLPAEWERMKERADYYEQLDAQLKAQGHQINTPLILAQISRKVGSLSTSHIGKKLLADHPQLAATILLISRLVRTYDFQKLDNLINSTSPLIGNAATLFDQELMAEIQLLIQPLFKAMPDRTSGKINELLGTKFSLKYLPLRVIMGDMPKLEGSITNTEDRFQYVQNLAAHYSHGTYRSTTATAASLDTNNIKKGHAFIDLCRNLYASIKALNSLD